MCADIAPVVRRIELAGAKGRPRHCAPVSPLHCAKGRPVRSPRPGTAHILNQGTSIRMNISARGDAMATTASLALAQTASKLDLAGNRLAAIAARMKARGVAKPGLIAAALVVLSMNPAAAQTAGGTGSLVTFLTNIVTILTGTGGTALAVIAVGLCGCATMFGAMSARTFGATVLGVAILFSAAWVVSTISGSGTT